MRKGEKGILIGAFAFVAVVVAIKAMLGHFSMGTDPGIPYFSTASPEVAKQALAVYRKYKCKDCHSLWTTRDMMRSVPAPRLDGIGAIRDEEWLYNLFSAQDPKSILPSRLKKEFQMPSFAHIPEHERRLLAKYMASLKVEDWYLEATKKAEYEKLTGKKYIP